jgi:cyclic pyranopterin phosphate synthase
MPVKPAHFATPRVMDALSRPMRSLRISVTDRCNLRCQYCMPEENYIWLEREQILHFEEIARLAAIFSRLGVTKFRLTGGEPLVRHDVDKLVALLASVPGVEDLALTTNGVLLERLAAPLRQAGLHRVTISLDTLRPERFQRLTRSTSHAAIVKGIGAAAEAGFASVKLNSVVIKGFNDDELAELLEFGRSVGAEVRFIEYMDVGGATRWQMQDVFARQEILARLTSRFGPIQALPAEGAAPADRFRLPDGLEFGIISSTTQPFCRHCDRGRLTPDGVWLLCLYAQAGISLREPLRASKSEAEMAALITQAWQSREDRGAEKRLAVASRGALFGVEELRLDPHREMHTRGG